MEEINKDEAFDLDSEELVEEQIPETPPSAGRAPPEERLSLGHLLTLLVDEGFRYFIPPSMAPFAEQDSKLRPIVARIIDETKVIEKVELPEEMPWKTRALIAGGALLGYALFKYLTVRQMKKFYDQVLAARQASIVQSPPGGPRGDQGPASSGGTDQPGSTPPNS